MDEEMILAREDLRSLLLRSVEMIGGEQLRTR
jgi:hypothetical protein